MEAIRLLLAFATVAILSWLGVSLVLRYSMRLGLVAEANERSSHRGVVPVGGGVGIVVVAMAAWALLGLSGHQLTGLHAETFMLGAGIIAVTGFLDDVGHLAVSLRMLVHVGVAIFFVNAYVCWNTIVMPVIGVIHLGAVGGPVTVLWIVGLINAYNFMDGLDGLLGGQATAAGWGWVALGLLAGSSLFSAMGVIIAGSTAGFLVLNWHPARIFMGDVGSTFLGYTFAVLPVMAAPADPRLALAGVLLVWPAVFDAGFTVLRRLREGESIFVGHRTFLFHRLVAAGWRHDGAALLYIVLPVVGAILACTWATTDRGVHVAVAAVVCACCGALWALVRSEEEYTRRRSWIGDEVSGVMQRALWPAHEEADRMVEGE
ncbi:MAG TPA: MraY family glycosyltransferase [Chloroflexota bacterium]|nr:MraY family glycosyltransferase [Chloroflexota bacterium]